MVLNCWMVPRCRPPIDQTNLSCLSSPTIIIVGTPLKTQHPVSLPVNLRFSNIFVGNLINEELVQRQLMDKKDSKLNFELLDEFSCPIL